MHRDGGKQSLQHLILLFSIMKWVFSDPNFAFVISRDQSSAFPPGNCFLSSFVSIYFVSSSQYLISMLSKGESLY